jgi:hypothetical protein
MGTSQAAAATLNQRLRISPIFCIGCGVVLILGAGLMHSLEPGPALTTESPTYDASRAAAIRVQKAREREALARAEQERQAAEEAAEKARRAAVLADGVSEAQARSEREERARRQAVIEKAQQSAAESEEAWKRFYRPSAACRDPSAGATVECVNEYVKAKREFSSRPTADASR